jgi:hypothetical protein
MPRNLFDKSIWGANLSSGFGLNNFNAAIPGQISASGPGNQTSQPAVFCSSEDNGKRIYIPQRDISLYSYATNGTLYGGCYQMIHVNAVATAANVAVGKIAYLVDSGVSTGPINFDVTDETHATSSALPVGVYLNSITPGNYGFIFIGGGKVNVAFKSGLTNGTPAVGDNVNVGAGSGLVDDISAKTVAPTGLHIGNSLTIPATAATSAIWMSSILGVY